MVLINPTLSGKSIILSKTAPESFIKWLGASAAHVIKYSGISGVKDIGDHADTGFLPLIDRNQKYHYFIAPSNRYLLSGLDQKKFVHIGTRDPHSPYPNDTLYNMIQIRNGENWFLLAGKKTFILPEIFNFCQKNSIKIIRVNQGYLRCSSLVIDNFEEPKSTIKKSIVITKDRSVITLLHQLDIQVINPPEIHVTLTGYDSGFFPGACGIWKNGIIICGSSKALITSEKKKIKQLSLITGLPIYMPDDSDLEKIIDIGSIFII